MSNTLGVRNCAMCSRMFKYKGNPLCPACIQRLDKEYVVVRDYLYDHPTAGIQELAEETKIEESAILHMVRTGRLTFAEGVDTGIHCTSCGRPITRGTMCDSCSRKMSQTLAGALPPGMRNPQEKKPPESSKAQRGVRMHTADRHEENW